MYFNVEHAWGDAAVSAHLVEHILYTDVTSLGYTTAGDCNGQPETQVELQRLQWDLNDEVRFHCPVWIMCILVLRTNRTLVACCAIAHCRRRNGSAAVERVRQGFHQKDARLARRLHSNGAAADIPAGASCKVFLDSKILFQNQGRSCLTYEASMTRLFREGRTETVRSCSNDSVAFVNAMLDANATVRSYG